MWAPVNSALNAFFDAVLWPASALPPWAQAVWLGAPGALLALAVFRYASDQEAVGRVRDRMTAHLLELRLYRDDFRVGLRAQAGLLAASFAYLRHALVPMAIMIGPFLLILAQVESRFAHRPLAVGEAALVTVTLDDDVRVRDLDAELVLSEALVRETPALRIPATREVVWRVRGERPGAHALGIRIGDRPPLDRHISVSDGPAVPSAVRAGDAWLLLYPAAAPLPDGPVRSVEVGYPSAGGSFAGLSTASWIFFGSSMALGFALRRPLGVTL